MSFQFFYFIFVSLNLRHTHSWINIECGVVFTGVRLMRFVRLRKFESTPKLLSFSRLDRVFFSVFYFYFYCFRPNCKFGRIWITLRANTCTNIMHFNCIHHYYYSLRSERPFLKSDLHICCTTKYANNSNV